MSERAAEHEAPAPERSAPAAAPIAGPVVAEVERLQRTAGNAAVARLLQRDEAEWSEGGMLGGEAIALGVKEDITSKFTVTIRGPWSDPDLADLQASLALLTSAELKWVSGTGQSGQLQRGRGVGRGLRPFPHRCHGPQGHRRRNARLLQRRQPPEEVARGRPG